MRSTAALVAATATAGALLMLASCAGPSPDAAPSSPSATGSSPTPSSSAASPTAPAGTVDLAAARAWVEQVQDEASDGPGAAGTAILLIGPDDDAADDVRVDFRSATLLTRAEARCYGGGTAEVEITVIPEPAAGDDSRDATVPCDEQPHDIDLGGVEASAVRVEGESAAPTYLYVTFIQAMTTER